MKQKFERKLISKEIELGFLYIPSEARRGFPKENDRIKVLLGKGKQQMETIYL